MPQYNETEEILRYIVDQGHFDDMRRKVLDQLRSNDEFQQTLQEMMEKSQALKRHESSGQNLYKHKVFEDVRRELQNPLVEKAASLAWLLINDPNAQIHELVEHQVHQALCAVYEQLHQQLQDGSVEYEELLDDISASTPSHSNMQIGDAGDGTAGGTAGSPSTVPPPPPPADTPHAPPHIPPPAPPPGNPPSPTHPQAPNPPRQPAPPTVPPPAWVTAGPAPGHPHPHHIPHPPTQHTQHAASHSSQHAQLPVPQHPPHHPAQPPHHPSAQESSQHLHPPGVPQPATYPPAFMQPTQPLATHPHQALSPPGVWGYAPGLHRPYGGAPLPPGPAPPPAPAPPPHPPPPV